MNISNHAKKRYIQRALGVKDWAPYLEAHDGEVTATLLEWTQQAVALWKGELGDRKGAYYTREDWVLVFDEAETALVTLYPVEFGFSVATNQTVLQALRKELVGAAKKREQRAKKYLQKAETLEIDREQLDFELDELGRRIDALKKKRAAVAHLLQAMEEELTAVQKEETLIVHKIVSTMAYREDVAELAKPRR